MKVLIIGANGKIGRILTKKLNESSEHKPVALLRKEEQKSYFDEIGVDSLIASIESGQESINGVIKDFDAVVFTAGSGGNTGYDKTLEVDLYGAIKCIEACKENNISRFIMVSAAYSDEPNAWVEAMRPYYIAKHLADKELVRSGLKYTILRPVALTNDEQAGKIQIKNKPQELEKEIPRVAVAETIKKVLDKKSSHNKILEMSEGSYSVKEALEKYLDN